MEAMAATIQLIEATTSEPQSATAVGVVRAYRQSRHLDPQRHESSRIRVVEQALAPTGHVEFSTGQSFDIDSDELLGRRLFELRHLHAAGGPQGGAVRPRSTTRRRAPSPPRPGDRFNVATGGAALEPEEPTVTCPEGEFDRMGRTVWYTIEGTGGPVTIDTAGSNFDTLIAVYDPQGESPRGGGLHRRRLPRPDRFDVSGGPDDRHRRRGHLLPSRSAATTTSSPTRRNSGACAWRSARVRRRTLEPEGTLCGDRASECSVA